MNKNSQNINFEVINFSGVAWSSVEFLTFLKSEAYKYKPDLVIISQGENDFRVQYNNIIKVNNIKRNKCIFITNLKSYTKINVFIFHNYGSNGK